MRVFEGALSRRTSHVLTFANGEGRLTVEHVSIVHGEHQLIHVFLPMVLSTMCFPRFHPRKLYDRL